MSARRSATLLSVDVSTPRASSRETLIAEALSAVIRMVDSVEKTSYTRRLRAQARSLEQTVKHWTAVAPTHEQLSAMFELVVELHDETALIVSTLDGSRPSQR